MQQVTRTAVIPVDLLNVAVQTAFIPPDSSGDNGLSLNPHNSPAPSTQHPTPNTQHRRVTRFLTRHLGSRASLTSLRVSSGVFLGLELPASNTKRDGLKRHEYDGEVDTPPALAAQSAEVGSLAHGESLPAARPAEKGIDCRRGIDGVEYCHGDDGRYEADERGDEHHWRVQRGVVAEL